MANAFLNKSYFLKLFTILFCGGTICYFGYILLRNLVFQSADSLSNSGGYIKYLLGWLFIIGLIFLLAFLNYKFLFLKLFYHEMHTNGADTNGSPPDRTTNIEGLIYSRKNQSYIHENSLFKSIYWILTSILSIIIFCLLQYKTDFFLEYEDENVFITILLISFINLYSFIADYFRTKRHHLLLLKEKTDAELSFLKAQINPHFLFNALNTIYNEAYREKNEKTAILIEKLAGILRFSVEESKYEFTSVGQEIRFLEQYLALQKARLPNRKNIQIKTNIYYDNEPAQIAPFLIIPFLENAFQYGISMDKDCFINIDLKIVNRLVSLKVSNSILSNHNAKKGMGTGIRNVQKRLDLQYKNNHKLFIKNDKDIFEIQLTILLNA